MPGAPSVDETYASLTAWLPARLRDLARELPHRLGLVRTPEASWGDFVGLHPNRELPLYAAQDPAGDGGLGLAPAEVHRFVRAHHAGGFYWLVRDRLRDGQVAPEVLRDERLHEVAGLLGYAWRQALAQAAGDGTLVDRLVDEARQRWEHGTALERQHLRLGAVPPTRYAAFIHDKLAWIAVPSRALLMISGGSARVGQFQRAHELFMLSLQVVDDVVDRDEDRALHGSDVPSALGCSPGALLRAAPKLATAAAGVAAEAGFTWFATWLSAFRDAALTLRLDGDPLSDELEAIGVAGEMEEASASASPAAEHDPRPAPGSGFDSQAHEASTNQP
jgi:hypothetical protein